MVCLSVSAIESHLDERAKTDHRFEVFSLPVPGDGRQDPAPLRLVVDDASLRREVGAHRAFQMDGEVGASLQVRKPSPSRRRGNAADEDLAVDVVKDDLDAPGPPALPPDSRDVDDPATGERTLHPLVQLGILHDLYNLCPAPIHPWRFPQRGYCRQFQWPVTS